MPPVVYDLARPTGPDPGRGPLLLASASQSGRRVDGAATEVSLMTRRVLLIALAAGLAVVAMAPPAQAREVPTVAPGVALQEAWPGVKFSEPTCCTNDGASDFMYIGEQRGTVARIQKYRGTGPVPAPQLFLDLRRRVVNKVQAGLLGLAFHPTTPTRVFVAYMAPAATGFEMRISEVQSNGTICNAASEKILLRFPKRRPIHQAGGLGFGPDGMLYAAIGDGGDEMTSSTDGAKTHPQNPTNPLGKILRLDVSTPGSARPPADNPWATGSNMWMKYVWAYGFRNPYRFDWDSTGRMWTAEPGTKGPTSREWVKEIKRGANHGWPFFEGEQRLAAGTPRPPVVMPAFVYPSSESEAGAAVFGKFYRGKRVPSLTGRAVFVDYMRGMVYALDLSGPKGTNWQILGGLPNPSCVGADRQGELYVCSNDSGQIMTIIAK